MAAEHSGVSLEIIRRSVRAATWRASLRAGVCVCSGRMASNKRNVCPPLLRLHTNTRGGALCVRFAEERGRGPWVNIHHTLGKLIHLHAIDIQPTLTGSIIINLTTRYLFWCPNSMRLLCAHALITLGSVSLSLLWLWLCRRANSQQQPRAVARLARVHTESLGIFWFDCRRNHYFALALLLGHSLKWLHRRSSLQII
jgi:hypothetical protein